MPGVGGQEIAAVLAEHRPDVPVVLMTYCADPIDAGVLHAGSHVYVAVDARNTIELVSQLQGRIERARRVGQQLQTSRQEILQQHRRLRAEQSILLRDARALAARRALPVCPRCDSSRVAPIVYGSERVDQLNELASGRVVLGGPQRLTADPGWYCRDREHRW
jgi:hypothetical protein